MSPGVRTTTDVMVYWFAILQRPGSADRLEQRPIACERLTKRRLWTTVRDLVAASSESEEWRQPTPQEWFTWELSQNGDDVAWLVVTTGEPGLGPPTQMAVRLEEEQVR